MKNLTTIDGLRDKGFRITKIRKSLLEILHNTKEPISAQDILLHLHKKDLTANKTTIYRELEFLLKLNLIKEIDFGDRKKRYEIKNDNHHHHILCLNCGDIVDIDFDVDLNMHEDQIAKQSGYKILEHSIEFFGYCKKCQS